MTATHLSGAERKILREHVVNVLNSDQDAPLPVERFLPLAQHAPLLHPNRRLIIGERGAGKTALFHFFTQIHARGWKLQDVHPGLAHVPKQVWLPAHELTLRSPLPDALGPLSAEIQLARLWWFGRIITTLAPLLPGHPLPSGLAGLLHLDPSDVATLLAMVQPNTSRLIVWLQEADGHTASTGNYHFLSYDFLDRLSPDGRLETAARIVAPLIALWMDLGPRLKNIGCKILLRPDLYKIALRQAPDTTKWRGFSVDLDWTPSDLLLVLLRHLSASDHVRAWLQHEPDAIRFHQHRYLGWMPPDSLPERPRQLSLFPNLSDSSRSKAETGDSQLALGARIAGEISGTGANRRFTHAWLIDIIRDGHDSALPRSLLHLIATATKRALHNNSIEPVGLRLLTPSDIEGARETVGIARLSELADFAPQAIDCLRRTFSGAALPLPESKVIALLDAKNPSDQLQEWQDLGLTRPWATRTREGERQWDLPDLFRKALGANRTAVPRNRRATPTTPQGE